MADVAETLVHLSHSDNHGQMIVMRWVQNPFARLTKGNGAADNYRTGHAPVAQFSSMPSLTIVAR